MSVLKDGDAKDVEAWGIMGHCWGGRVATLMSTEGTVFKAAAQCHPSLIEPSEAKNVVVPMAVLASGDEDKEVCFSSCYRGRREGGKEVERG